MCKKKSEKAKLRAKIKQKYLRKRKQFLKKMREINEDFTCEYCGDTCHEGYYKDRLFLTVDHIVPLSKDYEKATKFSNFAISCKGCNETKSDNEEIIPQRKLNNYPLENVA